MGIGVWRIMDETVALVWCCAGTCPLSVVWNLQRKGWEQEATDREQVGDVCTGYTSDAFGLTCIANFYIHFVRKTKQCGIYGDLAKIREGNCQQLTVQTQMVQVLPSVVIKVWVQSFAFLLQHHWFKQSAAMHCVVCILMYSFTCRGW